MVLPSDPPPSPSSPPAEEEQQNNNTNEYLEKEDDGYNQLLACQISFWYPLFAPQDGGRDRTMMKISKQHQCTFRTIFLDDLPDPEFVQYLHADQVILPKGVKTSSALLEGASSTFESDDDDDDDEEDDDEDTDSSSADDQEEEGHEDGEGDANTTGRNSSSNNHNRTKLMMHEMQILSRRMEDAIRLLGGAVIPKLNWSSPKDAVWMNGGTLECRRAGDIFLLLKSSDFIAHDLQQLQLEATKNETDAQQQEPDPQQPQPQSDRRKQDRLFLRPQLALRKWANLHPSQEFRCFCRNRHLVGICQRHHTEYYPHLANDDNQIRSTIRQAIVIFFRTVLLACSAFPLDSYVFDVYVDRKHKVWLVDFNVWGPTTDPLLFTWEELTTLRAEEEMEDDNTKKEEKEVVELAHHDDDDDVDVAAAAAVVEFRVVSHPLHVQAHPLSSYKAPVDVLDLAGDSQQFREFMNLCEKKRR
jgi:hypothetical protein